MFKQQIPKNLNKILTKNIDVSILRNLSTVINKISEKNLSYALELLFNHHKFPPILSHTYNNKESFNKLLLSLSLKNTHYELTWFIKYFSKFEKEISLFLELKSSMELQLLNNDIENALETIKKIEDDITISYWSIEMYSNTIKEFCSESPAKYINEIKKGCKNDNLTYFFLNQILIKSETTNNLNFSDTLLETLNKVRKESFLPDKKESQRRFGLGIVDLISSYLIPLEYDCNRNIDERNLSCFSSLSLIDQYLVFKDYLINRKLYGEPFTEKQEKHIDTYLYVSSDTELINTFNPITQMKDINDLGKDIVKSYSYGNYDYVIKTFKENITYNSHCITYLDLYVKSLIYSQTTEDKNTLYSRISDCFINIYLANDKCNESINYLLNIVLKFHHLSWSNAISYFLYNFIETDKINKIHLNKKMYPFGKFITPKAIDDFSYNNLIKELSLDKTLMPIYRRNKFVTKDIEISDKEDDIFINYKETAIIKSEYIKDHLKYLIKENEIDKCIIFVVNSYLNNINTFVFLPIQKLVDLVDIDDVDGVTLDTLILFDIYRKNISLDREEDLNDLYLSFMSNFNTHNPSEIYKINKELTNKEIYFLHQICITSIMDASSKISGNEKLLNERIEILKILEHTTDDKTLFVKEKNTLYEELSTDELKSRYNHGRIFVDVNNLRQIRETTYKRLFERYLILRENNEEIEDLEEYTTYEHINSNLHDDSFIPSTDLFSFIHELYKEHLLNDFVKNQNFGLEKYLSAEIRHGNLKTELRSTLENCHLITEEIDDGIFEDNIYWLEKYRYLDDPIKKKINNLLKNFSKEIDQKLINVEIWLKIVTEKENSSKEKFDFSASPEKLKKLRKKIENTNDFETFFDQCIEYMWEETYVLINNYKTKLENELKVEILDIFNDLKKKVSKESFMHGLSDLQHDIDKSENLFSEEINNVLTWFNRVDGDIEKTYSFLNIISSTEHLFKKIINEQSTKISFDGELSMKENYDLSYLEARAFMTSTLISLYNAKEYGTKCNDTNNITIDLTNLDNYQIIIKNEIDIERDEINKFLEELRKNFSDEKSLLSITEGGSGLHKIYNLFKNVSSKFYVSIDIEEYKYFCIYLGVNYENIDC